MEILQFLLSFFLNEYGDGKLKGVYDALEENSFDLKKFLGSLTPEKIAPIFKDFASAANSYEQATPTDGLSPILNFADRDVISTLNEYFESAEI